MERKKGKNPNRFRCVSSALEDHGKPLYGVAFCSGGPNYDNKVASVGANRTTVYELTKTGGLEVLQVYEDEDKEEELYAVAWSVDMPSGEPLLATGGVRGVVKVINTHRKCVTRVLLGHGAMINDLKWHPVAPGLLLSASKDESVRLWNVATQACVAVFAGEAGHRDDVLSISVHPMGNCFASAGMDNSIKVWALDSEKVTSAVESSYSFQPKEEAVFPTHFEQFPAFSTANVHVDYVDYVQWVGNMLVSKSTDSKLILWAPDTSTAKDAAVVLTEFEMKDANVWFVRGDVSPDASLLACGNQNGVLQVWETFPPEEGKPSGSETAAVASPPGAAAAPSSAQSSAAVKKGSAVSGASVPSAQEMLSSLSAKPYASLALTTVDGLANTIRGCAFSPDGRSLVAVCDNSSVWRWDLVHPRPAPSLEEVVGTADAADVQTALEEALRGKPQQA